MASFWTGGGTIAGTAGAACAGAAAAGADGVVAAIETAGAGSSGTQVLRIGAVSKPATPTENTAASIRGGTISRRRGRSSAFVDATSARPAATCSVRNAMAKSIANTATPV